MGHAHQPDVFLELTGDELRSIVRDDPGCGLRIALFGPLQNNLYFALTHLLSDLPVHDDPAEAIENTAQVVKRPADIQISNIDVPVLVGAIWIIKSLAFTR
jgi:hypothetical protein